MELPRLPAFPVGDVDGMRARARQLRALADEAGAIRSRAGGTRESLHFEGPAGTRIKARIHMARVPVNEAESQLRSVADLLMSEAARVEAEQAHWRTLKAKFDDAAREAQDLGP